MSKVKNNRLVRKGACVDTANSAMDWIVESYSDVPRIVSGLDGADRLCAGICYIAEMTLKPEWLDGQAAGPKQTRRQPMRQFGRRTLVITGLILGGFLGEAHASELVIGRAALQTLVAASVFRDQGRWYLARGKCYAYLERPHVALAAGRVIIDAHLSSLLGLTVGGSCVGTEMMSDVKVSGKLVGSGTHIDIDDIRIDNVQDDSTRQVIELLESATGRSLPRSANIDLLPLLKPTGVPGTDINVSASNLAIARVTTLADSVDVEFEVKLTAR